MMRETFCVRFNRMTYEDTTLTRCFTRVPAVAAIAGASFPVTSLVTRFSLPSSLVE